MSYKHVLLFTGHMIDPPTRKEQRFPVRRGVVICCFWKRSKIERLTDKW